MRLFSYWINQLLDYIFWNIMKWPYLSFPKKNKIKEIASHIALIIKDMQSIKNCDIYVPKTSAEVIKKMLNDIIVSLRKKGGNNKILLEEILLSVQWSRVCSQQDRRVSDQNHYEKPFVGNACFADGLWLSAYFMKGSVVLTISGGIDLVDIRFFPEKALITRP